MTVYVDNFGVPATVGGRTSQWSHLTADTREELHAFAALLGLRQSYFQTCTDKKSCPPDTCWHWHYDVTQGKREQAIRLGAKPVELTEFGAIVNARRYTQPLPPSRYPHLKKTPAGWTVAQESLSPKQGDNRIHTHFWAGDRHWLSSAANGKLFATPEEAAAAYAAEHGTQLDLPETIQDQLF